MKRSYELHYSYNGIPKICRRNPYNEFHTIEDCYKELTNLNKEFEEYKQSVRKVLLSYSQKKLTAKQLSILISIMEELNINLTEGE